MTMTHTPMARTLVAAGHTEFKNAFTYQDYLYELCGDGGKETPVTEQQWEMICDLKGKREMRYASSVTAAVRLAVKEQDQ